MNVVKISPRGYCYGVVDAMVIALETARSLDVPKPIYILGMIVHNSHVTEAFEKEGIKTLDGENRLEILEQIDEGTIVLTAHGVSPEVRRRAREKGLTVVDATCPDVTVTHDLIREKVAEGHKIIYIGRKGHPEPEGAVGVAPEHVHLIETVEDIEDLHVEAERITITNQTTMSQWDTQHLMKILQERYPHAEVHNEICLATQVRQEAVVDQARETDLVIVVGDPMSNNSNKLAEVSQKIAGVKAYRVADVTEIKQEWLMTPRSVGVTSGASTPTPITREVIQYLEQFDVNDKQTWEPVRTVNMDRLLPRAKRKKAQ